MDNGNTGEQHEVMGFKGIIVSFISQLLKQRSLCAGHQGDSVEEADLRIGFKEIQHLI